MSAFALVTGALLKPPEQRELKTGKPFVMATLRATDGNASDYWTLFAFAEAARAELMRLKAGDRLSAQGRMQVETYVAEDGATRISRTLLTDHVLALRQPRRRREPPPPLQAEADDNFDGAWAGPPT